MRHGRLWVNTERYSQDWPTSRGHSSALLRILGSSFNLVLTETSGTGAGLSGAEVLEARAKYGSNEQPAEQGTPFWKLVLKQFDDLLVKILVVAAVVDFGIALLNGESGANAFVEPGVIVMILIANATVGVVTETNAEKAIEELKAYEADVATVLRKGRLHVIPATQLVPGDIVEVAVKEGASTATPHALH
ncbi:hypothetical protein WJX82_003897 [Trebouxia sp. C0006]